MALLARICFKALHDGWRWASRRYQGDCSRAAHLFRTIQQMVDKHSAQAEIG
jgi:hypothetical protein